MNLKLLKNFATINPGIYLETDSPVATIAPAMNILAIANEKSEVSFGIYDINLFMSIVSLTGSERSLAVDNSVMTISDGKTKVKYVGAKKSVIVTPPDDISPLTDLPQENGFTLPESDLKQIVQASSVLGAKNIVFSFGEDAVTITTESEHDDANTYEMSLPCKSTSPGLVAKVSQSTMKMIDSDYSVSVSEKAIIFKSDEVTYYIVRVL